MSYIYQVIYNIYQAVFKNQFSKCCGILNFVKFREIKCQLHFLQKKLKSIFPEEYF